jgi:hypothetical protein
VLAPQAAWRLVVIPARPEAEAEAPHCQKQVSLHCLPDTVDPRAPKAK